MDIQYQRDKHFQRGAACFKKGQYDEAIRCWEHVAELMPDYASNYYYLGSARWNIGDRSGALIAWQRGADLGNTECQDFLRKYSPPPDRPPLRAEGGCPHTL